LRWRRAPYNDPVPPGAASCHLQRSGGILHFGAEPLTTIGSHRARPAVIYNHLVKFCTSAPSHLQRSGDAGRGQLSFTMIRCNFAPRRQAPYNQTDRGLDDKDSSKFKCGEIRKASGGLLVQRPTRTQCCSFWSAALRGML